MRCFWSPGACRILTLLIGSWKPSWDLRISPRQEAAISVWFTLCPELLLKPLPNSPGKMILLAGDKPVCDCRVCVSEASMLTVQMCVVILGIRPCNFSFVLPLVWHMKTNKLILCSMYSVSASSWCFRQYEGRTSKCWRSFFLLKCSCCGAHFFSKKDLRCVLRWNWNTDHVF